MRKIIDILRKFGHFMKKFGRVVAFAITYLIVTGVVITALVLSFKRSVSFGLLICFAGMALGVLSTIVYVKCPRYLAWNLETSTRFLQWMLAPVRQAPEMSEDEVETVLENAAVNTSTDTADYD